MILKKTTGEKVFNIFNISFMILLCTTIMYPMLYIVSRSFMTDVDRAARPFSLIPHEWTFEGYAFIFSSDSMLINGFLITIFRTVAGTLFSIILESMLAYAISKKYYPYRKIITIIIAFTMWFDGGLIPRYLLVKSLGFQDSIWVYVVPAAMNVWYILILRNFFSQIPDSIEESARIDGANEATVLFRLILPLSTAVIATISLFHMVYHWNEWFTGILYIVDRKKLPAMIILRRVLSLANANELRERAMTQQNLPPTVPVQMATVVVVALPIVIAYPFFQKYFVKGMLVGSIKG